MTTNPPPYAPAGEQSKGLYPSVPPDPYQQPLQAGAYPQQPQPTGYYTPSQQQVVVSPAPQTVVVAPMQPTQSFIVHIVLSCVVFWCCGCLCGLIAFIFASKLINNRHYVITVRICCKYVESSEIGLLYNCPIPIVECVQRVFTKKLP